MASVDVSKSRYKVRPGVNRDFAGHEVTHLRLVLRRLRYLEQQVREHGGIESDSESGGAAFAEMEVAALEWLLLEVDFIEVEER